jgi:hypothetical protein
MGGVPDARIEVLNWLAALTIGLAILILGFAIIRAKLRRKRLGKDLVLAAVFYAKIICLVISINLIDPAPLLAAGLTIAYLVLSVFFWRMIYPRLKHLFRNGEFPEQD